MLLCDDVQKWNKVHSPSPSDRRISMQRWAAMHVEFLLVCFLKSVFQNETV